MKRASYKEAIYWIANNDDTSFLDEQPELISVTAAFLCDIFDVDREKVYADIRRELDAQHKYDQRTLI